MTSSASKLGDFLAAQPRHPAGARVRGEAGLFVGDPGPAPAQLSVIGSGGWDAIRDDQ